MLVLVPVRMLILKPGQAHHTATLAPEALSRMKPRGSKPTYTSLVLILELKVVYIFVSVHIPLLIIILIPGQAHREAL